MIQIDIIATSGLGDRSYLVSAEGTAIVIDPQRDTDRVLALAQKRGARITDVFETHIHNDYVTGGFQLARETGASYHVSATEEVAFERHAIADGEEVTAGPMRVRALLTPGHTPHHMSYAVGPVGAPPVAVFTGGSLLYGTVGRTDLIAADRTEELTRKQYRSAHRLADELPPEVTVYPTHGFGSFCSSVQSSGSDGSTIGEEKKSNPALTLEEEAFVEQLIAGLTAYPRYYAHMGPLNKKGPPPIDLSPPQKADPADLRRRLHAGEWLVDLRQRRAFALEHLGGCVNVELGGSFVTYLGWTIPWGTPLTLLGDDEEQVAHAQRELVRIGIDRLAGQATGAPADWKQGDADLRSYPVVSFVECQRDLPADGLVLDARRTDEWEAEHVKGSLNVPVHEIESRLDDIPRDRPLWVHCASGYRASVAASLLARAGFRVVLVDDHFTNARDAGLELVAGAEASAS